MPTNKRERQRENRAKKLAEQQKMERRRKLRKRAIRLTIIAGVVAAALLLATLLADGGDAATTTTTSPIITTTTTVGAAGLPLDYEDYRAQPTACGAEAPPPVQEMTFTTPDDQGIASDATVTATITTSCGDIVALLNPSAAPQTVNSFVFLAREGYFDGSAFHRIMPGFVIQGGDPTAVGNGGPGYLVPDEFPEADFTYGLGVLAMANGGPNSTGSQFFIVTGEDARLANTFSAFGNVVPLNDTLDRITSVARTGRDGTAESEQSLPLETVYIESVEIEISS